MGRAIACGLSLSFTLFGVLSINWKVDFFFLRICIANKFPRDTLTDLSHLKIVNYAYQGGRNVNFWKILFTY